MARDKLAKMAFAKVASSIPTQSDSIIAVSNRVSLLEGENLPPRVEALESVVDALSETIITMQLQISALLSHTHNYDDGGVAEVTGTPNI